VVAPHSGTPFDLLQTGASAALVIGLCLLVVAALPAVGRRTVAIVFGAGTMTLSLYSLHVVMRTDQVWPPEVPPPSLSTIFGWHVLVLMSIGALFVAFRRRGPLEAAVSWASGRRWTFAGGPAPRARTSRRCRR
jgi:hypothetical protein